MARGLEASRARRAVTLVRAAGGVVVRERARGREVLLVHRPRHDDWTCPKGKCLDGELDEDCALREVAEETGLRCRLEASVGTTEYLDSKERPKRVRWWLMQPVADDGFTPNDEVDETRWVTLDEAARLLTYQRDRDLLGGVR